MERAQMMIESPNRLALQRFLQSAQALWLDEAQKPPQRTDPLGG